MSDERDELVEEICKVTVVEPGCELHIDVDLDSEPSKLLGAEDARKIISLCMEEARVLAVEAIKNLPKLHVIYLQDFELIYKSQAEEAINKALTGE